VAGLKKVKSERMVGPKRRKRKKGSTLLFRTLLRKRERKGKRKPSAGQGRRKKAIGKTFEGREFRRSPVCWRRVNKGPGH